MKKLTVLSAIFVFAAGFVYSQNVVMQMDEAVSILAEGLHEKLTEKNAENIYISQFIFNDDITTLGTYWVNHLTGELTNMPQRNYAVFNTVSTNSAGWIITGEIVQIADIVRVYTRLIRASNRSIEASFYSNFRHNDISDMISINTNGGSSSSSSSSTGSVSRDSREPDDWENPVQYIIGTSSNAAVMNRTITPEDEDFFLLIPESGGLLTIETTGSVDTFMYLYDYNDEDELATDDDSGSGTNARITYNVEARIAYLAVVEGYSSSTSGSYGFRAYLTVRESSGSWSNPVVYAINADEENASVLNRTISQGYDDYFLLVPSANGRVTVETTGRTDTYMELYDANTRELLDQNDDGGNNYNARIRLNALEGERYMIVVRGFSSNTSGAYGFRAYHSQDSFLAQDFYEMDDEPSSAKILDIGASQERTFHSANDVDWMRFLITDAGRYIINARGINSNRLDTYMELYDASLNIIAEDDDGGDSLSSRLTVNLNNGIYFLKIWCLDEEPNQGYTVNISSQ